MPSPLGEGQTDMPINRDYLGEVNRHTDYSSPSRRGHIPHPWTGFIFSKTRKMTEPREIAPGSVINHHSMLIIVRCSTSEFVYYADENAHLRHGQ